MSVSHRFNRVVSFETEELILVDSDDKETGFETKARCHDGEGLLHRAFSVFVFNTQGQLLLQQRSQSKRLWPLFWSNTCCSHPRRGETMNEATQRRLLQELGLQCRVKFQYKFQYHASYQKKGSERELCWVYTGVSDGDVTPNDSEIAAIRWIKPAQIDQELIDQSDQFTPWFKMEWTQIRQLDKY